MHASPAALAAVLVPFVRTKLCTVQSDLHRLSHARGNGEATCSSVMAPLPASRILASASPRHLYTYLGSATCTMQYVMHVL